jgi:parvulin-like peptidyl-prolyl cis-trans isomerase-like protein
MRSQALAVILALLPAACSSRPSQAQAEHASLGGDTVARVGDLAVPTSLVASVAAAQKVDPSRALSLLVEDALAAAGARAAGLDKTPEVTRASTAARARLVVLRLRAAAHEAGPPTDAEVNDVTAAHWLEVDLPERMRVIHAVVLEPKKPELTAAATALAADLAAAEATATSPDDFEARAKALPHGELEIKVERLDPFVADGRSAVPGAGKLELDFVHGAAPLSPGATSGVVHSKFGWHVIRMIERLPERRIDFEERRRLFREEVFAGRARRSLDRLLGELASKNGVMVENGVDEMMTGATMALFGVAPGLAGSPSPP